MEPDVIVNSIMYKHILSLIFNLFLLISSKKICSQQSTPILFYILWVYKIIEIGFQMIAAMFR